MAITGKIRKKSSGHRYVTIPKDEEKFSEGDHVIIEKVSNMQNRFFEDNEFHKGVLKETEEEGKQ